MRSVRWRGDRHRSAHHHDLPRALSLPIPAATLDELLVDRLTFAPFEENGVRGYRFEGEATHRGLLAGASAANSDGVPDGIRTRVSRLKIWGPGPG